MSKYSDEFKLEVVQYCLEEHHGFIETAKHFNIPSKNNEPISVFIRAKRNQTKYV